MSLSQGLGRPILTQDDLQAHRASVGNVQDVVYWPLFDANSYPAAGATQLSFFSTPIGQGTTSAPGATGGKTLADTNMYAAGLLAKGNEFYMTGQEFVLFPGDAPEQALAAGGLNYFANDVYNVGKSGVVALQVGSQRTYIQDGPLQNFPPSTRLFVGAAIGGTVTAGASTLLSLEYAAWVGEPYDITPIYIEATQGFQEYVTWPAAVTVSVTARLFSRMRGYLIRQAQ
jgi:hypothetical protein